MDCFFECLVYVGGEFCESFGDVVFGDVYVVVCDIVELFCLFVQGIFIVFVYVVYDLSCGVECFGVCLCGLGDGGEYVSG